MPEHEIARVAGDEGGLYGKEYWFSHQEEDLGYPNIELRARADLPERCLHWLKTLLRYRQPPASVLELGSAHGGFVALARAAGFDATGLELSPSIANLARRFFDIPVLVGPVEDQKIQSASLDVLAHFDVLEHLQDPVGTLRHCLTLLKPDGLLLIQTPRYREGKTYESMVATKDPFLDQLKSDEHLYLFSESSIRSLFRRLGADFLEFEPPIFSHYDMFLLVSRQPLIRLKGTPGPLNSGVSGRLLQAMLDQDVSIQDLQKKYREMDADRAARLALIHEQGARVGELEAEQNNLKAQLDSLSQSYAFSEADRAARLEVIHQQGRSFAELQAQHEDLRGKLAEQQSLNQEMQRALDGYKTEVENVNKRLRESEEQRSALALVAAARTEQIQRILAQLRTLQELLQLIKHSRTYRLLRRLGGWRWVDEVLGGSFNAVSPPDENKTS